VKKLGPVQQDVLAVLRRHGQWHRRCGWVWGTFSHTERVLNSLVRAGCVDVEDGVYRPKKSKTLGARVIVIYRAVTETDPVMPLFFERKEDAVEHDQEPRKCDAVEFTDGSVRLLYDGIIQVFRKSS
jgi:hypothetical protein